MAEPRHHDEGLVGGVVLPELPRHAEALARRGETRTQIIECRVPRRQLEAHPHEELAGLRVAVLLALDDVAGLFHQESGDGVHDAGAVGAAESEHEIVRSELAGS